MQSLPPVSYFQLVHKRALDQGSRSEVESWIYSSRNPWSCFLRYTVLKYNIARWMSYEGLHQNSHLSFGKEIFFLNSFKWKYICEQLNLIGVSTHRQRGPLGCAERYQWEKKNKKEKLNGTKSWLRTPISANSVPQCLVYGIMIQERSMFMSARISYTSPRFLWHCKKCNVELITSNVWTASLHLLRRFDAQAFDHW